MLGVLKAMRFMNRDMNPVATEEGERNDLLVGMRLPNVLNDGLEDENRRNDFFERPLASALQLHKDIVSNSSMMAEPRLTECVPYRLERSPIAFSRLVS